MFSLFNCKSAVASALAAALVATPALADAPQGDITAHIGQSWVHGGAGYSQKVPSVQSCYNLLATFAASNNSSESTKMLCTDASGALLGAAECVSNEVGWGPHWKPVCTDTTDRVRQQQFKLSPDLLKSGPVSGPSN